jgi:2-methylcitrate dehydratase PrpD
MSQSIEPVAATNKPSFSIPETPTATLSRFLADLRFESLPGAVIERTEEAFLDWFACTLAGRGARPVDILEAFAVTMGPGTGASQILVSRRRTSPFFAALVNGAASHMVELDDVHNSALIHPGIIVFPALLAVAQQLGSSGREFIAAAVSGYECAVRVGEFLGRSHYRNFHTTGTAGTLGAAAGVARLLGLDPRRFQHALGSAGTQAAGLWEFLRDGANSKPLHSAKASADGLLAAYLARDGFTGASQILEGERGLGAGMSAGCDPSKLTDRLGESWKILGASCKVHACCRHIHPSADALLRLMREKQLKADEIVHVTAHVHRGAIDVLGAVAQPETVHQSKFSMGFVLGMMAHYGKANLEDFSPAALRDSKLRDFVGRVEMVLDPEIDNAPGNYWGGYVEVQTRAGENLVGRVPAAKGDPQSPLDRAELAAKARHLAAYAQGATSKEIDGIISAAWSLRDLPDLKGFYLV